MVERYRIHSGIKKQMLSLLWQEALGKSAAFHNLWAYLFVIPYFIHANTQLMLIEFITFPSSSHLYSHG